MKNDRSSPFKPRKETRQIIKQTNIYENRKKKKLEERLNNKQPIHAARYLPRVQGGASGCWLLPSRVSLYVNYQTHISLPLEVEEKILVCNKLGKPSHIRKIKTRKNKNGGQVFQYLKKKRADSKRRRKDLPSSEKKKKRHKSNENKKKNLCAHLQELLCV